MPLGRNPITELEGKRNLLYKKLKALDENRSKLESDIDLTIKKISYAEWRITAPKIYYPQLDNYYTANEILELESFFSQKLTNLPSTDLTSLC